MITTRTYPSRVDLMTHPEARAFILFLLLEENRHAEDIRVIRERVKEARIFHHIDGFELARLYNNACFPYR